MACAAQQRYGTALTEGLLMSSRDGVNFHRWNEAFLRPGIERGDAWHYGQQYIGWHVVETKSSLQQAPNELSLYASESYWHGKGSALEALHVAAGWIRVGVGGVEGRSAVDSSVRVHWPATAD